MKNKILYLILLCFGCVHGGINIQNNIVIDLPINIDTNNDGKLSNKELIEGIKALYNENIALKKKCNVNAKEVKNEI